MENKTGEMDKKSEYIIGKHKEIKEVYAKKK